MLDDLSDRSIENRENWTKCNKTTNTLDQHNDMVIVMQQGSKASPLLFEARRNPLTGSI